MTTQDCAPLNATTMLTHNFVPTLPRQIWNIPRYSAGSIVEDSEVVRNDQRDEDPEGPINEVCIPLNIYIWIAEYRMFESIA